MAHIIVHTGASTTSGLPAELIIDGQDIAKHVLHEGFEIGVLASDLPVARFYVQVRLKAESLDIDLPDAVVAAIREESEVAG